MKKIVGVLMLIFIIVGCSNNDGKQEEAISPNEQQPKNTVAFQEIDVKVNGDAVHIAGEAKSSEREFFYSIEQGEQVWVEETKITQDDDGGEWQPFEIEITLPKEVMDEDEEDVPFIHFYGKSDDKKINPNYVPIDLK